MTRRIENIAVLMIGCSVIGAIIYLLHRFASSAFMELAHKLAV